MKTALIILIFPFLVIITVNETTRSQKLENHHPVTFVTSINPSTPFEEKCSWFCHNDTNFCKQHHVKFAKPFFEIIDPIYFGIIKSLQSAGNYRMMNILFLVILWPMLMYFLLIKSLAMRMEIKKIKNQ